MIRATGTRPFRCEPVRDQCWGCAYLEGACSCPGWIIKAPRPPNGERPE